MLDVAALREGRLEYVVPLRPFPSNLVWDIAYTPTARSSSPPGNGVVELWDATTLERQGSLAAGTRDDIATARPIDGHTVVIAHPRGQVLTWDTRPQHLLDMACRVAGRNLTQDEWDRLSMEHRTFEPACPDPD